VDRNSTIFIIARRKYASRCRKCMIGFKGSRDLGVKGIQKAFKIQSLRFKGT
jgi:hypothetical protein